MDACLPTLRPKSALRTAGLLRRVAAMEIMLGRQANEVPALDLLRADPERVLTAADMQPDPWQAGVLRSDAEQMLLLCGRQQGKSTIAAALAVRTMLLVPRAPVLLLSPTLRQSGELFRKILDIYGALGRPVPVVAESALRLELANGSRVVSLPGTEGTVRGFSGVALLIIDEAARVADPLYYAVRPMLAVSRGRLVALSTPFGQRGWFYDAWHSDTAWQRVQVKATECPRISAEFLASERKALGDRYFRQEYLTEFTAVIDAVFDFNDIQASLSDDVRPLFGDVP